MSHSFATWAAVIFWKACAVRRWAAAMLGCFLGLTFCAGFFCAGDGPAALTIPGVKAVKPNSSVITESFLNIQVFPFLERSGALRRVKRDCLQQVAEIQSRQHLAFCAQPADFCSPTHWLL